jgi:uncharacterized membrane protein SpoIIM required for sporulation
MKAPTLRQLVAINTAALASAALSGALVSSLGQHRVHLRGPAAPVPVGIVASARDIAVQNGRVWLSICSGVVSLGAVGAVVVVTNGFRFGMDATTVARSAPRELRFLLPHSTLEFAALALAAAACQDLGWQLFTLLAFSRRPARAGPGLLCLAASAVVGLAAAVVEALSRAARAG